MSRCPVCGFDWDDHTYAERLDCALATFLQGRRVEPVAGPTYERVLGRG